ncbi:MAG: hypothetical protein GX337_07540 [Christensenellaceae bacterium]|nr:hypothetical protein [Christensenellaceae bacterium]
MMYGSGDSFREMLMKSKGVCPNCKTDLTFEEAAQLGRKHGISDNVVMCKGCNHVFEVNLVPGSMTLIKDVTSRYPQIKPAKKGGLFSKLFGK